VTGSRRRGLSEEDRQVWKQVTETVKAYPGKATLFAEDEVPGKAEARDTTTARSRPLPEKPAARSGPSRKPQPGAIDRTERRRLVRGRLKLEASLDLHGLNQQQAHGLLRRFLESARQRGLRHVLVITGKGTSRGGEGILQRAVPLWLAQQEFNGLVSAFERAGRGHGGEGALYIRLRRKDREA
jgi:DNA-nicking Smr family endonuclease